MELMRRSQLDFSQAINVCRGCQLFSASGQRRSVICFKHRLIQGYFVSQFDAVRKSQVDPFPWNDHLVLQLFGNKEVQYVGVPFCYSVLFTTTIFCGKYREICLEYNWTMTIMWTASCGAQNTDRCSGNNTPWENELKSVIRFDFRQAHRS